MAANRRLAGSLITASIASFQSSQGWTPWYGVHAAASSASSAVAQCSDSVTANTSWPQDRFVQRTRDLRSVYPPGWAFPLWVEEQYIGKRFADFMHDANRSAIFFDEGDPPDEVLALATVREPVNIGMQRLYDQDKLEQILGWRTGLYIELANPKAGTLPPNIAIMCLTPVISGMRESEQECSEAQLQELSDPSNRVHVLNVVGYAFDSMHQPDQIHFLDGTGNINAAKRQELMKRFERIFHKIFAAALHYNLEIVVLSKFGTSAFAENFPGPISDEIWIPAFKAALETWAQRLKKGFVFELSLMGGQHDATFSDIVESHGFASKTYSYFPNPLRAELHGKLSKALLVNAWDSSSFIGNGNFKDNSLDGFMGRATALAVLGSPLVNPFLSSNLIPVPANHNSNSSPATHLKNPISKL